MKTLKNLKSVCTDGNRVMMRIGISTDFSWFELKRKLIEALTIVGYELTDIGDYELVSGENYPDFVVPLTKPKSGENELQNLVIWKNNVEACKAANKIPGVCAVLITEPFAPEKETVDEDLYVRCIGGQVKGYALYSKKVMTFLNADSLTNVPSNQRLAKMRMLGIDKKIPENKKYLA